MGFDAGDSNLYRYSANAPVFAKDPSGLEIQSEPVTAFDGKIKGTISADDSFLYEPENQKGIKISYEGQNANDVRFIQFFYLHVVAVQRQKDKSLKNIPIDPARLARPVLFGFESIGNKLATKNNKAMIVRAKISTLESTVYYVDSSGLTPAYRDANNGKGTNGVGGIGQKESWILGFP